VYAALRYYASDLMRAGTQQIVGDYKRGVRTLGGDKGSKI